MVYIFTKLHTEQQTKICRGTLLPESHRSHFPFPWKSVVKIPSFLRVLRILRALAWPFGSSGLRLFSLRPLVNTNR